MSRSGRQSNLFKHNIIEDKKNGIAITSKRLAEDLQTRPSKKSRTENLLQNSIDALDTSSQSSNSSGMSLSEFLNVPAPISTNNSSFDRNQLNNNYHANTQASHFSNFNYKQSDFFDFNTRYPINNYNNYLFLQNNSYSNLYANHNNNNNYFSHSSFDVKPIIDTTNQLNDADLNQLGKILTEFDFHNCL